MRRHAANNTNTGRIAFRSIPTNPRYQGPEASPVRSDSLRSTRYIRMYVASLATTANGITKSPQNPPKCTPTYTASLISQCLTSQPASQMPTSRGQHRHHKNPVRRSRSTGPEIPHVAMGR
ncbi:Uncharacterised protein [Mycobacteroides abscessus subsp. abscessus]|nr:Uncharacterised protein [Mycobacteroides abscessus subsp. abscessus]SKU48116.1 Uncharacterised protein [Mycobacteroides abscessus subsp. abscessus]